MSKRAKFGLVAFLLSLSLWLISFIPVDIRLVFYIITSVLAYVLTAWVIFEDLKGVEWISLLILPVMFVLGAGLFSYYLPVLVPSLVGFEFDLNMAGVIASSIRFLFFILIGLGIYAILLTENIFSVASVRSIALLRAARSVGFIMTLITGLFFFHTILSLRLSFWMIGMLVMIVSSLLSFQGLWSVDLKTENLLEKNKLSLVCGFLMGQLGMVIAFWPATVFLGALMLVSGLYALLGLFQQRLGNRVFLGNFLEYVVFSLVVVVVTFLITSWRG
jgi:hypothetical protein